MKTTSQQALIAGTVVLLIGTVLSRSIADTTPSPMASTRCWIYDKIYPVTTQAFKAHHLTQAQQHEIVEWATAPYMDANPSVMRWMRDPYESGLWIVWADPPHPSTFAIWTVVNKQYIINPIDCWIRGDMAPRILPTSTASPRTITE